MLFTMAAHRAVQSEALQPLAMWHKAEVNVVEGHEWYSKACRADREAVVLLDPSKASSKSKRLYIYIGHGQLTAGSSDLVTGLVMKAKDWQVAVSACVAIAVLTACCPGRPVLVSEDLCIIADTPSTDFDDEEMAFDADELMKEMASHGIFLAKSVARSFSMLARHKTEETCELLKFPMEVLKNEEK